MKIEIISDDIISVFINIFYLKDIDLSKNNNLILKIKDLLKVIEIRYHLNLKGFYKINVYPNKKLGIFLDIIKIDENEFSSTLDYRIIIYKNNKFYLECDDLDIFSKSVKKKYYNDKFYININDIDDTNYIFEYGNIIYGNDAKDIFKFGKDLN